MLGFTRVRRRALAAAATATAAVLTLGGCSSSDEGEKKTDKAAEKSSGGAFPVTIQSALGPAEIKEAPKRIVTLGQGSAETAIALGHTPVGIESYPWGSDKTGYLPWIHEAVTKKGEKLPKQFTGGEELDTEAIIELEPDLILAPWSGITDKQFKILKDIAPTVAYPDLPWSTNWDQQIEIISKAVGKPAEAKKLIGDIEKQLSDAGKTRPNYKDLTFSYIYNTGPGTLGVFKPEEQRVKMVSSLGLKVDPVVNGFKETKGTDSALIGLENAEKLKNSDLVFTFYTDEKNRKEIESQPLYGNIPAVKKGAVVVGDTNAFVTASSIINPLTVPWTIDRYLPLIDKAVKAAGK
ncbi:iron-siderophore ABC transporter substrate-binding protein [Streptomyces clavuligerus]|uniref:Putative iron-siderophore ABC transporter substrate-binding protein n=1 Tax=Streptomyces clavuligerus TaxID=1901 RepID=E2Q648_STRCL|nr:iron-siderophore ABC transporter substrate-binding protein [Streptomyces clavuligerus]ANW21619.1 iron ABC transporter substrate-binding protein [Streptomyces clavuligerus]AXU16245.1 iron-siderophore ABC transporter substrate-binding protein [Streptomyces clavuligerus]EFG05208.1 Putative iron-siderophore ABC transporter substrate-binding protein [Streptomyces clavuligerus]MBY6306403.1 iron-siderophore ABC transporter substrate-binding protein [Streptomyces clavuligerus]QCS09025.1 iron-sidero